jgi:fructokinase
MPVVYAIGETIYDIIFEDNQPVAARAGGAMLNTAVSLGRCKQEVTLLTEVGDDQVGMNILDFLQDNGVSTEYINPYPRARTPIALAFLDEKMSASYSFYKEYPEQRLIHDFPTPRAGDIVLFGSFYSLSSNIRQKLTEFLFKARDAGAFIVYDPNIRTNHIDQLASVFPLVIENISLASLVRGSDEDFVNLFNSHDASRIYTQVMELGCDNLIITRGSRGAEMISQKDKFSVNAKKIKAISTVGAGDTFNAGIIFGLIKAIQGGKKTDALRKNDWKEIITYGIDFAANACSGYDNYISPQFAVNYIQQ